MQLCWVALQAYHENEKAQLQEKLQALKDTCQEQKKHIEEQQKEIERLRAEAQSAARAVPAAAVAAHVDDSFFDMFFIAGTTMDSVNKLQVEGSITDKPLDLTVIQM